MKKRGRILDYEDADAPNGDAFGPFITIAAYVVVSLNITGVGLLGILMFGNLTPRPISADIGGILLGISILLFSLLICIYVVTLVRGEPILPKWMRVWLGAGVVIILVYGIGFYFFMK